jgi:hypothetical protein
MGATVRNVTTRIPHMPCGNKEISRKVHVTAARYKPLPAEVRSVTNLSNLAQKYTAICTSVLVLSTSINI